MNEILDVVTYEPSAFFSESLRLVYEGARALAPLMRALIRFRARFGE